MKHIKPLSVLEETLNKQAFSKNASIGQLLIDWPRLKNRIYINSYMLADIAESNDIKLDTFPDASDEATAQNEFKPLLNMLVPNGEDPNLVYDQLAGILHQGGLPSTLQREVIMILTDDGLSLDNMKNKMNRVIEIDTTEHGFQIKEIFNYTGNISKRDPDNPIYECVNGSQSMLAGICKYDVSIHHGIVDVKLVGMEVTSQEKKIETLLMKPALSSSEIIKTQLMSIKENRQAASPPKKEMDDIKIPNQNMIR